MKKTHTVSSYEGLSMEELKKKLAAAENQLETVERQKDRARAKADSEGEQRIALSRELTACRKELECYKRENASLKQRLDNVVAAKDKAVAALKTCEGVSEKLDAKLQKVTTQLEKVKADAEALRKFGTTTAKRAEKAEQTITELKDRNKEIRNELKKLRKKDAESVKAVQELVREQDSLVRKIHRLQVSQARDFENSGISSSKCPNKPVNSRTKSERNPGGQKGHNPYRAKQLEGDFVETFEPPLPARFLNTQRYEPTGKFKTHQRVGVMFIPVCTAVKVPEFRNLRTGKIEYPAFPQGYYNEVNYDGSIKALLHMMTHRCNVSIAKARQFLLDITGNRLDVSTGCIGSLAHEFASKTKEERASIFDEIASSRVVQGDFTFGRMNGKQACVLISATPDGTVLFQAREKKGLDALKGSPLEYDPDKGGEKVIVSDHESTFVYHCGDLHQECLAHVIRTLIEIMQQEPTLKWPKQMLEWIKSSIHFRNQVLRFEAEYTTEAVEEIIESFYSILALGKKEYASFPGGRPKMGYNNGVNLLKRLSEAPKDYTLFLYDLTVPPTNSLCEIMARMFKRKAHAVMTFRSYGGLKDWCECESVFLRILSENQDLFISMEEIFDKPAFDDCATQRKPRGLNRCHTEAIRIAMESDDETSGESAKSTA